MSYRFIENRLELAEFSTGVLQCFNASIDGDWRQAGEGMAANKFFVFPTTDVDCDISSNSATANQTVLIMGWDSSDNEIQEVKTLNGQTRVQLTNQYYRIKAIIITSNSQTTEPFMDNNQDHVYVYDRSETVTAGVPDDCIGICDIGKSISKMGYLYLPAGQTLALVSAIISGDTSDTKLLRTVLQFKNTNDNVWKVVADATFSDATSNFPLDCASNIYDADYGIDIRVSVRRAGAGTIDHCMLAFHYIRDCSEEH